MVRTVKEVGPPSPPTVVVKAPPPPTTRSAPALTLTPKQRQAFHRWIIGIWFARYLDGLWWTDGYNWRALATCETGQDWQMTGTVYSSAFGIMNEAVRENATPGIAARILAGRGSPLEQLGVAVSIERKHSIRSWGCWAAAEG